MNKAEALKRVDQLEAMTQGDFYQTAHDAIEITELRAKVKQLEIALRLQEHAAGRFGNLPVNILYRNYKGVVGWRSVVPYSVWFGANEWHPEPQWLMNATDTHKGVPRTFAIAGILDTSSGE